MSHFSLDEYAKSIERLKDDIFTSTTLIDTTVMQWIGQRVQMVDKMETSGGDSDGDV